MYILGLPKDTSNTFKQTVKYAKKIKSSYAQFSVFTPYPGTPIFNKFKDIIIEKKLENFNQYKLTFTHKNFSVEKI